MIISIDGQGGGGVHLFFCNARTIFGLFYCCRSNPISTRTPNPTSTYYHFPPGFCNFQFTESSTTNPDPFLLLADAIIAADTNCPLNYISILNSAVKQTAAIAISPQGNNRCGTVLSPIDADTVPGAVVGEGIIYTRSEIRDFFLL